MSNSLQPHELQHTRLPCPSLSAGACSDFIFIKLEMPFNHLILCRCLFLLPSVFPNISVFSNESVLHIRWPKYWSFSFSISLSKEHPGLISFRMDWLYLLAVQGTLKSLRQHHSSKASILQRLAFFHHRGLECKGSQKVPGVTGKLGLGVRNEAQQRLTEFSQENRPVITNTLFQQHDR